MTPRVTLIIPNYNRQSTVEKALKAAVLQTVGADEVIVIDDGSTDGGKEIINAFCSKHEGIRFVSRPNNIGLFATLNEGLSLAQGDIIYFGASDDQILDTACETAKRLFSEYPEAGILCGHALARVDDEERIFDQALWWADQECYFDADSWVDVITYACPLSHSTFYKREALHDIGGFREELKWHADWFSQHVLGFMKGAIYTPQTLSIRNLDMHSFGESGIRDRDGQREVLAHALRLLKQEPFRQLHSHFSLSGTFAQFGLNALRIVLENPEFDQLDDFKLVAFALAREMLVKKQEFSQQIERRRLKLVADRENISDVSEGQAETLIMHYPFRADILSEIWHKLSDQGEGFALLQRAHRLNPYDQNIRKLLMEHPLCSEAALVE